MVVSVQTFGSDSGGGGCGGDGVGRPFDIVLGGRHAGVCTHTRHVFVRSVEMDSTR